MRSELGKAVLLFLNLFLSWQVLYVIAQVYPSLYDEWLLAYLVVLAVILSFFVLDKQKIGGLGLRRTAYWKRTAIVGLILAAIYNLYWAGLGTPIFSTIPVRFVSHGILSVPYNLSFSVTVGVVEETAFRGYILRNLSQVYSSTKAIAYSSILFGLYHFSPVVALTSTMSVLDNLAYWSFYVLAGIVVGLFLGYFYTSSQKTTIPTITYHSLSIFFESLVPFTLATTLIVAHLFTTTVYFFFIPLMIILKRRHLL